MTATLTRLHYLESGIFGRLNIGEATFYTLEHAYAVTDPNDITTYVPKVQPRTYNCVRVEATKEIPYECFELQDVPNFQDQLVIGIKIHIGNFNKDSKGCICIGKELSLKSDSPMRPTQASLDIDMISQSAQGFKEFMSILANQESFELIVL
jgi:hypothetical protein